MSFFKYPCIFILSLFVGACATPPVQSVVKPESVVVHKMAPAPLLVDGKPGEPWTVYLKYKFEDKRVNTLKVVARADEALAQRDWPYEKAGDKHFIKFQRWPVDWQDHEKEFGPQQIRCDCRWIKQDQPQIDLRVRCLVPGEKKLKEIISWQNFEFKRIEKNSTQNHLISDDELAQQIALTIATLPFP